MRLASPTGTTLWERTLSGPLSRPLVPVEAMTQALVQRLQDRASPSELLASVRTPSESAYEKFLEAKTYYARWDLEEDLDKAVSSFREAASIDPDFAAAYAGLGRALVTLFYQTNEPELIAEATEAVASARRLEPQGDPLRLLPHERIHGRDLPGRAQRVSAPSSASLFAALFSALFSASVVVIVDAVLAEHGVDVVVDGVEHVFDRVAILLRSCGIVRHCDGLGERVAHGRKRSVGERRALVNQVRRQIERQRCQVTHELVDGQLVAGAADGFTHRRLREHVERRQDGRGFRLQLFELLHGQVGVAAILVLAVEAGRARSRAERTRKDQGVWVRSLTNQLQRFGQCWR